MAPSHYGKHSLTVNGGNGWSCWRQALEISGQAQGERDDCERGVRRTRGGKDGLDGRFDKSRRAPVVHSNGEEASGRSIGGF